MSATAAIANGIYALGAAAARRRFERALSDPGSAQRAVLARILRENADSEFGRTHRFGSIRSVGEYRERIAPRTYDDCTAEIDRIVRGEQGILTVAAVRCVEPSGGSSGASKLVPYTAPLLAEFSAATMPWVFDLLRHRPRLRAGRAYWAVSPPARHPSTTGGGVPIGLEHDSDYFPAFARALLDRVIGTPRALAHAPDITTCRYLTLRALIALPDLALVSVWNPSFLTLLAEVLDEEFERLVRDLERGTLSIPLEPPYRAELERALPPRPERARALRRRFGTRAPVDLGSLWPRLALVSCWTEGHATRALVGMRRRFPEVEIQGKGLLATEGVVSIPLFDAGGCVAAVTSHFLEFVPEGGAGEARQASEVEEGARYEVLLTTSGGLYRYRLRDVVRVEGWYRRTPVLSFVGRADGASDIAGEKLTPEFVEHVLDAAMLASGVAPPFAMLAPSWGEPPAYRLYVECRAEHVGRLADEVERRLGASHHYGLCRALGQLGAVQAVPVREGARAYERACLARGQRAGSIKPPALERGWEWDAVFGAVDDVEASV